MTKALNPEKRVRAPSSPGPCSLGGQTCDQGGSGQKGRGQRSPPSLHKTPQISEYSEHRQNAMGSPEWHVAGLEVTRKRQLLSSRFLLSDEPAWLPR